MGVHFFLRGAELGFFSAKNAGQCRIFNDLSQARYRILTTNAPPLMMGV
jgi:hypothetical protein